MRRLWCWLWWLSSMGTANLVESVPCTKETTCCWSETSYCCVLLLGVFRLERRFGAPVRWRAPTERTNKCVCLSKRDFSGPSFCCFLLLLLRETLCLYHPNPIDSFTAKRSSMTAPIQFAAATRPFVRIEFVLWFSFAIARPPPNSRPDVLRPTHTTTAKTTTTKGLLATTTSTNLCPSFLCCVDSLSVVMSLVSSRKKGG